MEFDPQDPRWTAYVLGELDAHDMAILEQQLEQSAAARQLVEELCQTVDLLSNELQAEPTAALSEGQHVAIEQQCLQVTRSVDTRFSHGTRRVAAWSALAASMLMAFGLWHFPKQDEAPRTVAGLETARIHGVAENLKQQVDSLATNDSRFSSLAAAADPASATYSEQRLPGLATVNGATTGPKNLSFTAVQPRYETKTDPAASALGSYQIEEARHRTDGEQRYMYGTNTRGFRDSLSRSKGDTSSPNLYWSMDLYAGQGEAAPLYDLPAGLTNAATGRVPEAQRGRFGRLTVAAKPASAKVVKALSGNATLNVTAAPLKQVTDQLQGIHGVTIRFDEAGMKEVGVTNETLVTEKIAGVQLRAVLAQTLNQTNADLTYVARGDELVITNKQRAVEWGEGFEAAPVEPNTESYDQVVDNPFFKAGEQPLSTFSIDVDTASYSNIRRFLTVNQQLPPKNSVRIEEMINYFRYDYVQPEGPDPFAVNAEVAGCPWNSEHRLLRIGIKGREISQDKRPASNLVFLIDVSGSMNEPRQLPLVKQSMKLLSDQLTENDQVAIVVYAGNSGVVLPSTGGSNHQTILGAIDRLEAGGSTNGGEGIQLAYKIAAEKFIKGGTNRVILATDGDFNVGITDREALIKLVEENAKSGVFLTALGFGMGNIKDATLEQLADKGNGNYAYIDDFREAKKVLVEQMTGTLITIAKDVKIQLELNPVEVGSYRLIGYENRVMQHADFNNDKKDAGEIGAGHTVTALYELVPPGKDEAKAAEPGVDPLKYQTKGTPNDAARKGELLTLKLRYKQPDGDTSKLLEYPVKDGGAKYSQASRDTKFAAAVAAFGMLLRDSPHKGTVTMAGVVELAQDAQGSDEGGYRSEFVSLVRAAEGLQAKK